MLTDSSTSNPAKALVANLHASGPAPCAADSMQAFGDLVGSWHIRWSSASAEFPDLEGELHFGWVLGGRAIQDVWIVPGPGGAPAAGPVRAFHGSTIRFFDPAIDAWRSTWIEPINARVRTFIGQVEPGGIVLISNDDHPILRWRFSEIADHSFTWTGEFSEDGHTWQLEETMVATRVA
jgi:hypothetical protein